MSAPRTVAPKPNDLELRALRAIGKANYITCANLGAVLWGRSGNGSCSCPWARPAGAVVKRLRAKGLVDRYRVRGDHRTFYQITNAGLRSLERAVESGR